MYLCSSCSLVLPLMRCGRCVQGQRSSVPSHIAYGPLPGYTRRRRGIRSAVHNTHTCASHTPRDEILCVSLFSFNCSSNTYYGSADHPDSLECFPFLHFIYNYITTRIYKSRVLFLICFHDMYRGSISYVYMYKYIFTSPMYLPLNTI